KASQTAANLVTEKCTARKGHKAKCTKVTKIAEVHKVRVQKAQKTAMNKLMGQIGKPYHWGGTSPRTGFDCSGLVYYAYKDLVKFRIPRTANEMYHLRDASPVNRGELENGDLVFFRTQGRGTADHVGVYVGNGKFIQSPRSGQDIQITSLSEDYWVRHYVGARRVMTPKTIR
ncbi:C40 family peptidase, partial [Enterobacter quasiroggenkampii]